MNSNLKKIIISMLAITFLTACGGGGGGGGGSTSPAPVPIPTPPNIQRPNIDIDKEDNNTEVVVKNPNGEINFKDPNNKTIVTQGKGVIGVKGRSINLQNNETIKVTDEKSSDDPTIESGVIDNLEGYSYGSYSKNGEVNIQENGKIHLSGDRVIGVYGEDSTIRNGGEISGTGENIIGILAINNSSDKLVVNGGKIELIGKTAIGMKLQNATGINNNGIEIKGDKGVGISVVGKNSSGINNGKIEILGDGIGVYAGYGATGINNVAGEIIIYGKGYGMYADNVGYVINNGTIILSAQANGAMVADGAGAVAENRGNIIVDSVNPYRGREIQAINGGKIINKGTITYKKNATIYSVGGTYVIGTGAEEYGRVKADNIVIDGNVAIDNKVVKGGYRRKYTFDNVFEANSIGFGKHYKLSSELLYDSKLKRDSDGNYDAQLERNNKMLSDFSNKKYLSSTKMLDRYFFEEEYSSLSKKGQELIDSIDISNKENLNRNLRDLTPDIYANNIEIAKDIEEEFNTHRESLIDSLGEERYNFSIIGGYNKLESKDEIAGYKMQSTGVVGVFSLENRKYLSFGYSYNDINYRENYGDGNVYSLYLAFDKYLNYNKFNINFGVAGEYNIHEVNREMESFETIGEADFNSYILKTYGKISKEYRDILNIEPYGKLNLEYYNFEAIDEKSDVTKIKIDSEEYFSIKPEVGTAISKEFEIITLYGNLNYSYELGNLNKELKYRYAGIDEKGKIESYEEKGEFEFALSLEYQKNSFIFNIEMGKVFGERDNKFISSKVGYRF